MPEVPPGQLAEAITDAILAGIVTISADAIICVDDEQRIIFFNEGAEVIFGWSSSEVMGQPLEVIIAGTNEELALDILKRHGYSASSDMDEAVQQAVALAKGAKAGGGRAA